MRTKSAAPVSLLARASEAIATRGAKVLSGVRATARQTSAAGRQLTSKGLPRHLAKNLGTSSTGKPLVHKGFNSATKRMATRAGIGAVVGAGGSMIRDKSQGKDISLGRAFGAGVAGAAVGGAMGTTMGKRMTRKFFYSPKAPNLSTRRAAKSMLTPAGLKANVKNLSPIEKGFMGMTAYDMAKTWSDPSTKGQRGASTGLALGEAGVILGTSRWRGMRRLMGRTAGKSTGKLTSRGWQVRTGAPARGKHPGTLGVMGRSVGASLLGTAAGYQVGKKFDDRGIKPEAPYG